MRAWVVVLSVCLLASPEVVPAGGAQSVVDTPASEGATTGPPLGGRPIHKFSDTPRPIAGVDKDYP